MSDELNGTLKKIIDSIDSMKQSFDSSISAINARVDDITSTQRQSDEAAATSFSHKEPECSRMSLEPERSVSKGPESSRKRTAPRSWADRTDTVDDLPPLDDEAFKDDDECEEDGEIHRLKLSEETVVAWSKAVSSTLNNSTRKELRNRYPVPETDTTRVPKLDEIFQSSESKFHKNTEAKAVEKDLLHISACTLDVARPLMTLIEGVKTGDLTPEDVEGHAIDALRLLGNSISHTSKIRRKRVLKVCNPDISSLADDQNLFEKAPPMLFGEGFETKIKGRAEALKILHTGQSTSAQPKQNRQFFRGNRPSNPQRGGGYGSRGRGYYQGYLNRYNPYKNQQTFPKKDK